MTAYPNSLAHSQDVAAPSAFGQKGAGNRFQVDKFLLNRKVLSLGNKYYLYDENQQPLFFIDRPILKIKAHIGVYTDESKSEKLLTLTQDSALAIINQSFTLEDANGQKIASYKRHGWASALRRTWKIYDANNQEIAVAREDVLWKALMRRFFKDSIIGMMFVTNYHITRPDGTKLGEFNRRMTLADKHVADFTADASRSLDRRIVVGMCILLDNVERTR
jgi:uncharacterized protein YxjI